MVTQERVFRGGRIDTSAREQGYQSGFGNTHSTEAEPGALPIGRNSPQRPPLGLYADQALMKPPEVGSEKPFHQDNAYFDVTPDDAVVTC